MFSKYFILFLLIAVSSTVAITVGPTSSNECSVGNSDDSSLLAFIINQLEIVKTNYENLKMRMEILDQEATSCKTTTMSNEPKPIFDVRVDELPAKCQTKILPRDCAQATACTGQSGIYRMFIPQADNSSFLAYCDDRTDNGDWLVIQIRTDGSENFTRPWNDYKNGFGQVDEEYWLGLDTIYALTNLNAPQELYIELVDFEGAIKYAKYNHFKISNKDEKYKLKKLGLYSGSANDSLTTHHLDMYFSTYDRDNDKRASENCAFHRQAGWWFNSCGESSLNGKYFKGTYSNKSNGWNTGTFWSTWRGYEYSYKHVKMMIRRQRH